jgi:hypothetical protein
VERAVAATTCRLLDVCLYLVGGHGVFFLLCRHVVFLGQRVMSYFASRPITEAVKASEDRQQALKWIEDVRALLIDVEN